jgi:hypothetical protein
MRKSKKYIKKNFCRKRKTHKRRLYKRGGMNTKPEYIIDRRISWHNLSANPNPNVIPILEMNQDKIYWNYLSSNPNAIDLLKQNPDKINWWQLSKNPNAIDLLKQNLDRIDWFNLSSNPNAIELLKQNPDKIRWDELSKNPNALDMLIKYDYNRMNQKNKEPAEELVSKVMHPERLQRMADVHGMEMDEYAANFDNA